MGNEASAKNTCAVENLLILQAIACDFRSLEVSKKYVPKASQNYTLIIEISKEICFLIS